MKGIQVCLDNRTDPHQRGDNHKNANIGRGPLKPLLSVSSLDALELR
jgi:hypothetical protein